MEGPDGNTNGGPLTEQRHEPDDRPKLGGISVRETDIEPVRGLRAITVLFRGMSMLLLVLMATQVFLGATSTVDISAGVLFANAIRLIIFAGLLWGFGELAAVWVRSHHDVRATRILVSRVVYLLRHMAERGGSLPPSGSRQDRAP